MRLVTQYKGKTFPLACGAARIFCNVCNFDQIFARGLAFLKISGPRSERGKGAMAMLAQTGPEQAAVDFGRLLQHNVDDAPDLKSVLSTAELKRRPSRPPDHATENRALSTLMHELAASPHGILRKLAETAMAVCDAHSAGISLLSDDQKSFHWPVIVGQWASHQGGGTPRDYGPCGTVLDRNVPLLFSHPERDFSYFAPVTPLIEEALLIPFYVEGKAVGTIWVIAHDHSRVGRRAEGGQRALKDGGIGFSQAEVSAEDYCVKSIGQAAQAEFFLLFDRQANPKPAFKAVMALD